jgi:hypothetical protein
MTNRAVLVGNKEAQKVNLCVAYTFGKSDHIPKLFDDGPFKVMIGEDPATLVISDTSVEEDEDFSRPLSYSQANVFLLCFSIMSQASLVNVKTKWALEVMKYCPDVPCVLVGVGGNGKGEGGEVGGGLGGSSREVEGREVSTVAESIGAVKYVECDVWTLGSVKEVFDEVSVHSVPCC